MEKIEKAYINIENKIKNTTNSDRKIKNLKKIKNSLQKDWNKHYQQSNKNIDKKQLQIDLKIIKPKRMIIPNIYDFDDKSWTNAIIEYTPNYSNKKYISYSETKYYYVHAINIRQEYVILRPIEIIPEAEFEDIFGKYDSLLELYIARKFPVLKINKEIKIKHIYDLMEQNSIKKYNQLIKQIKQKVPYYPKFGYKYLQAQQDFNLFKK
jgi:hypothetical protein